MPVIRQCLLCAWREGEERDKETDRDRDRVDSLYSSCSKRAVDKHLTSSRQAMDKYGTQCTAVGNVQIWKSGQDTYYVRA